MWNFQYTSLVLSLHKQWNEVFWSFFHHKNLPIYTFKGFPIINPMYIYRNYILLHNYDTYNSLLIAKHAVLIIFTDRKISNIFFLSLFDFLYLHRSPWEKECFSLKNYQNCGSINDEYGQCSSLSLKKTTQNCTDIGCWEKKKPSIWQSKLH